MEKAIGSENSGGAGFRASGGAASAADLKNDNNNNGSALTKDQRIEKVKYLRSQVLMHFTSDSLMLRCAILLSSMSWCRSTGSLHESCCKHEPRTEVEEVAVR